MIYLICNSIGGSLGKFSTEEADPLKAYASKVDVPLARLRRWGIQALPPSARPAAAPPIEQPAENLEKVLQSIELRWYEIGKSHIELLARTAFLGAQLMSLRKATGFSRGAAAKSAGIPFEHLRCTEEGYLKQEFASSAVKLIRFYRDLLRASK